MRSLIDTVFSPANVVGFGDGRSLARAAAYVTSGRVTDVVVAGDRVTATVRGTLPYRVVLVVAGGKPGWECSCPAAEDGSFCKHCAALALTLNPDGGETLADPVTGAVDPTDAEGLLRAHIEGLDHDRLVDLVLSAAAADWRLRERLHAEAAAATGTVIDSRAWRRRLEAVFSPDDFVGYHEAAGWASDVHDAVAALEELLDAGHAADVVELAEYAHRLADAATQEVDDSDGWLSGISEAIGELHRRACAQARPDPVALACRLVDLELTSELDAFHRAAARYGEVLGAAGLAQYQRLVEPRWQALGPDGDRSSSERFRLRQAMIGVALASGDPDELIRVRRDDLRTPDAYLEIARTLVDAGRADDAIDWARRGLEAFADRSWQTPPLRELLARLLRERGDVAGSVELFWAAFESHPAVDSYRRLLDEAGAGGTAGWQRRAIAALRARAAEGRGDVRSRTPGSASALIEILLYEGDVAAAWEAAVAHGCAERLWLTLARAREATHPLDAIPIYEREVSAQIGTKKNPGYRAAADLLARIRRLASASGEPGHFDRLLASVRTEHKAKQNLMALLDGKGW